MKTNVLRAFSQKPWAILPEKLAVLEEVVARHAMGEKLDAEAVQAAIHGGKRPVARQVERVAVLPLFGTIFPRANLMTQISGATSSEQFGKDFMALVDDPEIDAIVLDVDSPGGYVGGVQELADIIYSARGKKPIVAVSNHTMASAAYWIGTAADEVAVSPSGEVGSIGVFAVHQDVSKALEMDGVKMTIISQGKYKVEGNPYQPLDETAMSSIQTSVDESYASFVAAVARQRGVSIEDVRGGFGEGRMVSAQRAVALGMADRVETLDAVVARLLGSKKPSESFAGSASSDAGKAELERETQSLRQKVTLILQGENDA